MPVISYILLGFAVQGLFLAFTLRLKQDRVRADGILALWLLILSLDMAAANYYVAGLYLVWPQGIGVRYGIQLVYGPILLLYVRSLLGRAGLPGLPETWLVPRLLKGTFAHFLPLILLKLYLIPLLLLTADEKLEFINAYIRREHTVYILFDFAQCLHGLFYTLMGMGLVWKHRRGLGDFYTYTERVSLFWLYLLLLFQGLTWGVVIAFQILALFGVDVWIDSFAFVIQGVWVYLVGYFGLNQPVVFRGHAPVPRVHSDPPPRSSATPEPGPPRARYEKTRLSPERFEALRGAILQLMDTGIWREGELTLARMASATGQPMHHISQVLNEGFGVNLFQFVNGYRLKEARDRLADPAFAEYSILRIALECGFQSKSAFNSLFKKNTGMTPSVFRAQNLGPDP